MSLYEQQFVCHVSHMLIGSSGLTIQHIMPIVSYLVKFIQRSDPSSKFIVKFYLENTHDGIKFVARIGVLENDRNLRKSNSF